MTLSNHRYALVSDAELPELLPSTSSERLSAYDEKPECRPRPLERIRRILPWIIHAVLLTTSICIAIWGWRTGSSNYRTCLHNDVIIGESLKTQTVRFDGSFDRFSPFKGPPSPEVDAAWDSILPLRLMAIPEDIYTTLNASKHAVKVPPSIPGTGRFAIFEALHQIHCVRSMWKATYPDYYTEESSFARENEEEWREHMDHCADMLRQKLMCDADTSLITYNWLKNHYNPHPNFHVQHQCRDYGRLVEAVEEWSVDLGDIDEKGILRPEGAVVHDFVEPPFDPLAEE